MKGKVLLHNYKSDFTLLLQTNALLSRAVINLK